MLVFLVDRRMFFNKMIMVILIHSQYIKVLKI
nr:MAG TPA: hypothetical protein [Caudoviricetes sp.]